LSLSKSTTVIWWYISVGAAFGFGVLFVCAWLSEEFAESEKWKARRKLLITLAIIGVVGEQLSTLAEFGFSEHLQTIDETTIVELQQRLVFAQNKAGARFLYCEGFQGALNEKPKGQVEVWYKREDAEAYSFATQIRACLESTKHGTGWTVLGLKPIPDTGGDPSFPQDVPAEIRYGGTGGVDLFLRIPTSANPLRPDTSAGALWAALGRGRGGPLGVGSSVFLAIGDPSLPPNHFVVVVGEKQ
jgi:hypothetical protein